ncbi:MAG: acetyl-CoA C-acyltransferase [Magnetovibrio sp.]|nr:acetyl-CoA C-acyltransferase [Magnetovibrio sp.]
MTENDDDPVVIVGARRTPIGMFQGELLPFEAPVLGAKSIAAVLTDTGIPPNDIDEVLMGCVLSAGLRMAPARQAALGGGLPHAIPCTTINKVCGSGMKALMQGFDAIHSGASQIVLAGGMESMTNAPYLLPRARSNYRIGHGSILDHMFLDGLEDAYDTGTLMGVFGEQTAEAFGIARDEQDEYAAHSLRRSRKAQHDGLFGMEITPIELSDGIVNSDEQPRKASLKRIAKLKPVFAEDGTITAANASSISDGAAALMLMRRSDAEQRGLKIRAVVHAHATHAHEPSQYTTAPIDAVHKVLGYAGWPIGNVDLFEINEAFAVVVLVAMEKLGLPLDIVNIHGGACALGHPIGATGARIVVTLLNALETHDLKRGIATICIGGGEATAVAIEREVGS